MDRDKESEEVKLPTIVEQNKVLKRAVLRVLRGVNGQTSKNRYLAGWKYPRSKKHAIRGFCSMCVGFEDEARGIRDCTSVECPLFLHRPFKVKGELS